MPAPPNFPPVKYDLQTRFGSIYGDEERKAMEEVMLRDAPTSNIKMVEFEQKFAEYCGTKYAITVSNGTAALEIAYKAIDVQPGDEVITTPITWIATAAAAETQGVKIIFCDIDPATFNLDPTQLEKLITSKTKAICPVHLYGQPVDMDPIMEIAQKHGVQVIEDSAHAPGGKYHTKCTGNIGDVACFSFHEQKNMSTLGEGGMITTNDSQIYERARSYKSHCARVVGKSSKYLTFSDEIAQQVLDSGQFWFQDFDDCGHNFRMNDITAAVGICQLAKLDEMNDSRRQFAAHLDEALSQELLADKIKPLAVIPNVTHTYHLYPVLLNPSTSKITREELIFNLRMKHGIKTGIHYMPLVLTTAFNNRGYTQQDAPTACEMWPHLVTLPIHPRMESGHIDYMIQAIKSELL